MEQALEEKTKLIALYRDKYGHNAGQMRAVVSSGSDGATVETAGGRGPMHVKGGGSRPEGPRACDGGCIIA